MDEIRVRVPDCILQMRQGRLSECGFSLLVFPSMFIHEQKNYKTQDMSLSSPSSSAGMEV